MLIKEEKCEDESPVMSIGQNIGLTWLVVVANDFVPLKFQGI